MSTQSNWLKLKELFGNLPTFVYLCVVKEGELFKVEIMTPDLKANATINEGNLVDCGIPLRTDGLVNCALMAQFIMLIQPEPTQTFYVRILPTMKGFVGLHEYEGGRKVISFSNKEGLAVKFIVKDVSLVDLEQFLMKPTSELVVIHTTGTPFSGVIGNLVLSTAQSAYIRFNQEILCTPTGQWTFLQNILPMF